MLIDLFTVKIGKYFQHQNSPHYILAALHQLITKSRLILHSSNYIKNNSKNNECWL